MSLEEFLVVALTSVKIARVVLCQDWYEGNVWSPFSVHDHHFLCCIYKEKLFSLGLTYL